MSPSIQLVQSPRVLPTSSEQSLPADKNWWRGRRRLLEVPGDALEVALLLTKQRRHSQEMRTRVVL